ncbi:MAG TPA: hybrid sensor histidine kinase/response regulator [Ktedonobacteraceae bacterium]|nr:hybrid sensor histidine kinase/response regulator [Ktedonobacteraceae bacterium]
MQEQGDRALSIMEAPRVLLVDDDPMALQAIAHMLTLRLGEMQVDVVDSAQNALQHLQTSSYDAILSDIKMPGMSGFDLLDAIRRLHLDIPVVLMTGYNEHELAIQALRAGAYDYLHKPIERDELATAMGRALQTGQLRRQVQLQRRALLQYAQHLEQQVAERTEALSHINCELHASNEAKEQILQIVTHELAGPVTSVKGMLHLLRRNLSHDRVQDNVLRYMQTMERSLARLQRLIGDLQDLSYIQTHTFIIQRRPYNLVELCQEVLDGFTEGKTRLPQPAPGPLMAEIDPERMSQVLLNLLSNARKYSSAGAPITVLLQQSPTHIILSVQDQGRGIPSEALSRIYDQFYRVPEAKEQGSPVSGLGLGLTITRAIVEQHEGRIEVQSTPREGSIFSVLLPVSTEQPLVPASRWIVCDEEHGVPSARQSSHLQIGEEIGH